MKINLNNYKHKMITNNPIEDMLIRIKNGQKARKQYIFYPKHKVCIRILPIIYQEGYIKHYSIYNQKTIRIWLKYSNNLPVIKNLSLFFTKKKPIFLSLKKIWKVDSIFKLLILSTTKGFLSGISAKKKKVGGELMCIIE